MSTSIDRPVPAAWRWFFLVAAVYDIALGLAFMVAGETILEAVGMDLPPHIAYIQLAAVFILVQGLSYLLPWHDAWPTRGSSGSALPTRDRTQPLPRGTS